MKVLFKESLISIKTNFKRFISILLIVLLGVGFFAGIKATSPDMKASLNNYYEQTNFMDLNLISSWGITDNDIETIKEKGYEVEPAYEFDAIVKKETEEVIKILSYDKNNEINKIVLLDGKLPTKEDECLIEQSEYTISHKIGDKITVESNNLNKKQLTIVGIIKSPIYTSLERGTTQLLSGKINFFMYVPIDNFNIEYYTNLYIKLDADKDVFSKKYKSLIDKERETIEKLTNKLGNDRYKEEKDKANLEIEDQERKISSEEKKYNEEIKNAKENIKIAKEEYNKNLSKLNKQIKNAEEEFDNKYEKLNQAKKEIKKSEDLLLIKEEEYNKNKEILYIERNKLLNSKDLIINNIESIDNNLNQLYEEKKQLEEIINGGLIDEKITKKLEIIIISINTLEKEKKELNDNLITINTSIEEIDTSVNDAYQQLTEFKNKLSESIEEINKSEKLLLQKKELFHNTINDSKKKLSSAYSLIIKNEKELNEKIQKAEAEFEDAKIQIKKAKEKVELLEKPQWYVLDHESNLGYYQYNQDTERINNVGKVFPLVFFVVAILICLTSMTRMVEEERNQLGTLKALGYSNLQIISKYIIYALLATIIGSILGVCIGMRILPAIIINMYMMMYKIGDIALEFNIKYALLGTFLAISCTLIATLFACFKELREDPASLMRPKSPKAGKRVLLEKITFIWKRLSFTRKVTVRNVFRYKKRFLMTIIGIAGCTGLIIAGFGLEDCITGMVPSQYGQIFNYQIEIVFKDDIGLKEKEQEVERISKIDKINKVLKVNKEPVTIENKSTNQSLQLIVPFDSLDGFITLQNRKTKEKYTLDNNIIVTEKIANLLNLKEGSKLVLKTDKQYNIEVGNITENYFNHLIYMDKDIYNSNYYNTLLIKTNDLTEEEEKILSKEIRKNDKVASIIFTSSTEDIFASTMDNFRVVAIVLIISAGLLAFVVLYNLANVNISERKRELATIKVLGFYDKEVYNYIGRETTILTTIGIMIGILIGKILTIYILKTCEIDSFMFNTNINMKSYIYAILITIGFTILVNITTYFSLKKVDMIESLKSVE